MLFRSQEGKILIAQINAGALSANHYFNGVAMSARQGWTDAAGFPTAVAPSWVLCPAGHYAGLNFVQFWHPDWRAHVLKELANAVDIGANGVFIDEFSAVIDQLRGDCAQPRFAGVDFELEMLTLLREMKAYVATRNLDRRFYFVVSDGQTVYRKYPQLAEIGRAHV